MNILIVYYSLYGHTLQLAKAVQQGASSVAGIEAILRRIAEFPENEKDIENSKHASKVRDEQKDIPVCTLDDLKNANGLLLGTPTRYGNMAAQMKRFIDSTASLWLEGAMEGKPVGLFTSTATTHGGQETTLFSMIPPLLHLGMLIVGVPYSTPGMLHTEGRGGTPYGASTIAGSKGELAPTPEDLGIAEALGRRVAEITVKLKKTANKQFPQS